MSRAMKIVFGLLLFNAISAIGGGIALMSGTIVQPSWVEHTDFASLYFAGLILMAIVGGSAVLAAILLFKRNPAWQLASITAGVIMLFWIGGEIVSIRNFHGLQAIYFLTGLAIIIYTPRSLKLPPGLDG